MPPAVGIVAGLATVGLGTALGIGFLTKIGVSLLLSAASEKLAGRSSDPEPITGSGRTQMIRQPITAHRIIYGQVRVGGPITFVQNAPSPAGLANNQLQLILTVASHECEELSTVWLDEEELPTFTDPTPIGTRWQGGAAFYRSTGTTADDDALGTGLRSQAPSTKWSTGHRQTGHAKIAAVFFWNPVGVIPQGKDLFPGSLPKVNVLVKGRKVYDPRNGAHDYDDPSTWEWSDNAALCLLDYLAGYQLNSDGTTRVPVGLGENLAGIDTASFIAAANVCDETVPLQAGGTEARYTCNGTISTSEEPKSIIQKLLTAMNGKLIRTGGEWRVLAASYVTPTITLTEDDLEGPVKVTSRLGRRELFNSVKGVYVSPDQDWQPTDLPPLESATFISEDQGEQIWKDVVLPFTTSASMAQRIMKIDLLAARQQISVGLACKLTAFRVLCGDTIMLTLPRFGWTSKVFEVKDWKFSVREGDTPRLGVDLILRETASAVYEWDSSEEDPVDPAPDTDFPDAANVQPPTNLIVTEGLYVTADGVAVKAKAVLNWTESLDAFLDEYQVEFKLSTDSIWSVAGRTDTETFEVLDMVAGTYDFRVKALNVLGVSSDYVVASNVQILGLTTPPGDPSGLTIQKMGGLAVLQWTQATDLDVRVGGNCLFRHSPDTATPDWNESVTIGEALPGTATLAILPLKPGTYFLKFEDSSGNQSASAATVESDAATVLEYGNLSQIDEHPTFLGTHNGTVGVDGVLKLAGETLWDDFPDVDAVVDVDGEGGIKSSGTYGFATNLDLGSVTRVRLRSVVAVVIENQLDLIDSRTALVDTWQDWDGLLDAAIGMDAQVWVRATNDNPGGSPTWTAYERLDSAEFENRAFEFQCRLTSGDPAYNILVNTLSILKTELV